MDKFGLEAFGQRVRVSRVNQTKSGTLVANGDTGFKRKDGSWENFSVTIFKAPQIEENSTVKISGPFGLEWDEYWTDKIVKDMTEQGLTENQAKEHVQKIRRTLTLKFFSAEVEGQGPAQPAKGEAESAMGDLPF